MSGLVFGMDGRDKSALRRFPIQGGPSILWSAIAPHEEQALKNHWQSLERLAERQGLSPGEALAVMEDRPWHPMNHALALTKWSALVKEFEGS